LEWFPCLNWNFHINKEPLIKGSELMLSLIMKFSFRDENDSMLFENAEVLDLDSLVFKPSS